jgi:hypothetical protein
MRKPDFSFIFFCYKNKKKHEENAKFGNNTTSSAPLRLCVRIFEDKLDVYGGQNEYDIDH